MMPAPITSFSSEFVPQSAATHLSHCGIRTRARRSKAKAGPPAVMFGHFMVANRETAYSHEYTSGFPAGFRPREDFAPDRSAVFRPL